MQDQQQEHEKMRRSYGECVMRRALFLLFLVSREAASLLVRPARQQRSGAMCLHISPTANHCMADELLVQGWSDEAKAAFVAKYWQKQPVLIRGMFFGASGVSASVPSKQDLLRLSMDDDVESRILQRGSAGQWTKDYGPFGEGYLERFMATDGEVEGGAAKGSGSDEQPGPVSSLSDCWTLLVQEVDRHIPAVSDMWAAFDFIPAWRRDDVMISYASPGGGIGAHVDNYDVFLLQGRGTREWSIERAFLSLEQEQAREVKNSQTRLLRDFGTGGAVQTWTLQPGDVLYLPPRIPHRGTALGGGCTTVSFGFRAPAYRSLLTALTAYVCDARLPEGDLYVDPDLHTHTDGGSGGGSSGGAAAAASVSPEALEGMRLRLRSEVEGVLSSPALFGDFMGRYLTEPLRMRVRSTRAFFLDSPGAESASASAEAVAGVGAGVMRGLGAGETGDWEREEESDELPLAVSSVHAVASPTKFPSAEAVLLAALEGEVVLRRAEGVRCIAVDGCVYYNGEAFPLPALTHVQRDVLAATVCGRTVGAAALVEILGVSAGAGATGGYSSSSPVARFMCSLLRSGLFYPATISD